jgi:hypothetical protein
MLGLPSATSSAPFPFDDNASWLSTEDRYNKRLCEIAGLVLTRNQGDSSHGYGLTQEIDERLGSIAKQMPSTWWEIPTCLVDGRTDAAASQFERIMSQIWHFELETLVHLPFMLRAATDRRYEYSRISCLNASRNLIKRWMFIRGARSVIFISSLVEFQAFTSAITILLGLLGPTRSSTDSVISKEQNEDMQLIETVVQILEARQSSGTGLHVVNQSISVIRTLQNVLRGNSTSNLRLSIQHFGTISITRGGTMQLLEGERIVGAHPRFDEVSMHVYPNEQAHQSKSTALPIDNDSLSLSMPNGFNGDMDISPASTNNTLLQFTSSQFPMFEVPAIDETMQWPTFQENDVLLFNGLLDTDVEGNWAF